VTYAFQPAHSLSLGEDGVFLRDPQHLALYIPPMCPLHEGGGSRHGQRVVIKQSLGVVRGRPAAAGILCLLQLLLADAFQLIGPHALVAVDDLQPSARTQRIQPRLGCKRGTKCWVQTGYQVLGAFLPPCASSGCWSGCADGDPPRASGY